jgi:TetR/AcrR family transcriptional repressor of mexJK operon
VILAAARRLFLEHGFASTSVDAVTAASGVSKPTVYCHFPTKEALLEAVVRGEAERLDVPVEFQPTGNPRKDLERVAQALTTMALAPETLAWDRMMAGEARRKPELGRVFFECGPRRTVTVLASFLRDLASGACSGILLRHGRWHAFAASTTHRRTGSARRFTGTMPGGR